jgi:hypothetical protein
MKNFELGGIEEKAHTLRLPRIEAIERRKANSERKIFILLSATILTIGMGKIRIAVYADCFILQCYELLLDSYESSPVDTR